MGVIDKIRDVFVSPSMPDVEDGGRTDSEPFRHGTGGLRRRSYLSDFVGSEPFFRHGPIIAMAERRGLQRGGIVIVFP